MTDPEENPQDAAPAGEAKAPAPPELAPTVTVARLDASGVYWGVDTIDRAALTPEHVEVPANCDLEPGAYRWNAADVRFDPIERSKRAAQPGGVSLEEAVYELTQLIKSERGSLTPRLAQWLEQYRNSVGRIGQKG